MDHLRTLISGLAFLSLLGCRNLYEAKRPYDVYEKPVAYFQPLFNESQAGSEFVTLENASYPIELRLYKDKTFHYHLARLGDGEGTWEHRDGHLELYAERKIFVMRMQVLSVSPDEPTAESISLEFSDRFGPKFLPLTRKK